MLSLPLDVWIMMLFSILAFFGVSLWMLIYSLRQEERKMEILETEGQIDTHPPQALNELRTWIQDHPHDPDVEMAREIYRECVEALQSTDRHFYDWSNADVERLESL
jgi:hypothetical protein